MRTLRRWRPSLRMARRDLLAHPLRTLVAVVLVALPVAAAVVAATVSSTEDWLSPNSLRQQYGTADAQLTVTDRDRVRAEISSPDGAVYPEPLRRAARRDPADVDVQALLPEGSRVTRVGYLPVALATGGELTAEIGDLDDPLTAGTLPVLRSGRAPAASDEVATSRLVADELAPDGTVELADGTQLRVVGTLDTSSTYDPVASVLLPPTTVLATRADRDDWPTYLVDLPDLSTAELQALRDDLAAAGVGAWVRDSVEHPGAWGTPTESAVRTDAAAVAIGALVIGLGLVEVVVVVGAVFAVGARRQARVLGLMIASGAAASDVRRTLLAQGLCVGVVASALGGLLGWAVLGLGREPLGDVGSARYLDWSVPVAGVVCTLLLGVASAVVAAVVPAWGVGRMTAGQALDRHVATGPRAHRHRTRTAGLWTVGVAREYRLTTAFTGGPADPVPAAPGESPVPVLLGALCALAVLVGVGLLVPWLVALAGGVTARGWLPWRLAARDAARNRGRTVASVLAVGMVTTGAVFTGFAVSANAGTTTYEASPLPADVAEVSLSTTQVRDAEDLARLEATLSEVAGATSLTTWQSARRDGGFVVARGFTGVRVVDETFLVSAGVDPAARRAFADGTALVAAPDVVRGGEVLLRTDRARGPRTSVPALEVDSDWAGYEPVWISADLAEDVGARVEPSYAAWATIPGGLQPDDALRLALRGIDVYGPGSGESLGGPDVVLIGALAALVLTALVVGLVVALAASDGRDDAATLAAVGAPPRLRRAVTAGHALFVGGLGAGLGLSLGTVGGASLTQVLGSPGTPVPWSALSLLLLGVPLTCAAVGWLVAPGRLVLTRRAG
jgi:putative ABC transport system permease protein